ncbi:mucin-2 [Folsomia candida]|uniref:mucin-2 n=1 Tax=Folsomia candida TaxID=158441 RepID=UPI000B8F85F2|nr:mucin-2 [Folsomia candida]
MEFFKKTIFCRLLLILLIFVDISVAQTGSSFFYYYSPNQPMVVNSQTFGSNPQAYHHSSTNPFDFIPSDQTREDRQGAVYPTGEESSPFLPQRNIPSSLLDKIAFTNGPPTLPSLHPQYQYNYQVNTDPPQTPPTPTRSANSLFPGQTQPSGKLFNFLNQPFQFFQNSFNRFHHQQQHQQQQEEYDDNRQSPVSYNTNEGKVASQEYVSTPSRVVTVPPPTNDQNQQTIYSYYDQGRLSPARFVVQKPKTTPLTFSVNQYFTSKTTKGPASYTFTIEANPTVGPTAKVQVSVGSDSLSSTFPTLPPALFSPSVATRENKTTTQGERDDVNVVQYEYYDDDVVMQPVVTTTPTSSSTPPVDSQTPEPQNLVTESASFPSSTPISTTPEQQAIPETTPLPTTTTTTTTTVSTTSTEKINIDQENGNSVRKPVKRVIIVRKKLVSGNKQQRKNNNVAITEVDSKFNNELVNSEKNQIIENVPTSSTSSRPEPYEIISSPVPPKAQRVKRPRFRSSTPAPTTTTTTFATTTTTEQAPIILAAEDIEPATTTSQPEVQTTTTTDAPTTVRHKQKEDYFIEPLITTTASKADSLVSTETPVAPTTTDARQTDEQRDAEFEYYEYYDDQTENSYKTPSVTSSTEPSSTTTTELVSTSTELSPSSPSSLREDNAAAIEDSNNPVTTIPTTLILEAEEDELIEPLSTTEPYISSTSAPTTEKEIMSERETATTTEQIHKSATTEESIITATTFRPSNRLSTQDDEMDEEVTTIRPVMDYDVAKIEGETATNGPQTLLENTQNTTDLTDSTNNANLSTTTSQFEHDFHQEEEYFYSQEEYIGQDPLEDERIQEAQRLALQNALKNIRSRQQNASTTDKPDEENADPAKKFIRRPTNVNSFPSSTSISVSFSSTEQDDEELEDSRSNIIHKIQTFRTKLRKVVNRTGKKSTTTKRPRRVTRPHSIVTPAEVVAETSPPVPEKVVEDQITTTSTTTTTTTSPPETTPKKKEEKVKPTPPPTLGSLIITEILPTSTSTSTQPNTTTTDAAMQDEPSEDNQEPVDFETEDDDDRRISTLISSNPTTIKSTEEPEEIISSSTTIITQEGLSSSPQTTELPLNITTTTTTPDETLLVTETSTSRTIRERKVKVILKRRKGAPKGTGTVARQVVRTRTRVKQREDAE